MKECRIFASVCGKCPAVVCRLGSIECIGYHLAKPIPVAVATGNYRLCDAIAKLNLLGTQRNNWRKQTRELQEEQINWLRFYCFSCTIFQFVHGFFIFIHHLPVTWFLSCNTHTRWRNQTYSVNLRYALCVARSHTAHQPELQQQQAIWMKNITCPRKTEQWKMTSTRGRNCRHICNASHMNKPKKGKKKCAERQHHFPCLLLILLNLCHRTEWKICHLDVLLNYIYTSDERQCNDNIDHRLTHTHTPRIP